MSNELNNDHLDELFRRHLAGHEEDPPEEVWQNIRPQLAKKGRRTGGWMAWLLLAVIAGGVIFWENRQERRLQKLEEQLARKAASPQKTSEAVGESKKKPAVENAATSETATSQAAENQPHRQAQAGSFSAKKSNLTSNPAVLPPLAQVDFFEKQAAPPDSFFVEQPPASSIGEERPEVKEPPFFGATVSLNAPVWQSIFSKTEKTPPLLRTDFEVAPVKFQLAIEVYFNPAFALSTNHLAKTGSEITPDLGYRWNAGVLVEWAATKRWSLLIGVDYGILAPIAYDEKVFHWNAASEVTLPGGNIVNQVSFEAATALGKTFVNAQVKKNANNVQNGEAYIVRVVTQPKVALMTVPLVVKYYLSRGRFSAFLKAGAGGSHLLTRKVNLLKISVTHSERWSILEAGTGEELLEMEDYFLQGCLGFGAAYRFDRHFSLLAEPTWSFSFSPLNQQFGQDIRPAALGLQVAGRVDF